MKIAIDSGPLSGGDSVRGIGTYVRQLTKYLKGVDVVDFSKVDLSKYDVAHFTRFHPFFISLPFTKPLETKFILTIYDLIPLIYPKHYPPGIKGSIKWQINKFLIKKNVDAIITISETSKKDICRILGVKPEKVYVIYLAPSEIYKKLKNPSYPGLSKHFALYVGDINYNKNIPEVIKKAKELKLSLVIAGKQAKEIEEMDLNHPELKHLKKIDWSGIIRLGYVPDDDLVKLFNLADTYIHMSFYEGFGLPVLEALACGTKVVTSKAQALVEILGRKDYSWEKTAKETGNVYHKVISNLDS